MLSGRISGNSFGKSYKPTVLSLGASWARGWVKVSPRREHHHSTPRGTKPLSEGPARFSVHAENGVATHRRMSQFPPPQHWKTPRTGAYGKAAVGASC